MPLFKGCSQYFPISQDNKDFATFQSGMFRVSEIETVVSNDDYIEKEFLLEKYETAFYVHCTLHVLVSQLSEFFQKITDN